MTLAAPAIAAPWTALTPTTAGADHDHGVAGEDIGDVDGRPQPVATPTSTVRPLRGVPVADGDDRAVDDGVFGEGADARHGLHRAVFAEELVAAGHDLCAVVAEVPHAACAGRAAAARRDERGGDMITGFEARIAVADRLDDSGSP